MNKFYAQIDEALKSYENRKPYHPRKTDWICNRIDWCYKWRKISKAEMEELVDRVMVILENYDIYGV